MRKYLFIYINNHVSRILLHNVQKEELGYRSQVFNRNFEVVVNVHNFVFITIQP